VGSLSTSPMHFKAFIGTFHVSVSDECRTRRSSDQNNRASSCFLESRIDFDTTLSMKITAHNKVNTATLTTRGTINHPQKLSTNILSGKECQW
jgi:hypothetical protein